jgi:hypothetical protein
MSIKGTYCVSNTSSVTVAIEGREEWDGANCCALDSLLFCDLVLPSDLIEDEEADEEEEEEEEEEAVEERGGFVGE